MNTTFILAIDVTTHDGNVNQIDLRCSVPTVHAAAVLFNAQINAVLSAFSGARAAKGIDIKFGRFLSFQNDRLCGRSSKQNFPPQRRSFCYLWACGPDRYGWIRQPGTVQRFTG